MSCSLANFSSLFPKVMTQASFDTGLDLTMINTPSSQSGTGLG
jgi:hypothetical protein